MHYAGTDKNPKACFPITFTSSSTEAFSRFIKVDKTELRALLCLFFRLVRRCEVNNTAPNGRILGDIFYFGV
jgi:hypothetical protein